MHLSFQHSSLLVVWVRRALFGSLVHHSTRSLFGIHGSSQHHVILFGENKKRFPQMVPIIDAVDHMAQTWSIDTCGNEMNGVRQLAPHVFHFIAYKL